MFFVFSSKKPKPVNNVSLTGDIYQFKQGRFVFFTFREEFMGLFWLKYGILFDNHFNHLTQSMLLLELRFYLDDGLFQKMKVLLLQTQIFEFKFLKGGSVFLGLFLAILNLY